MDRASRRGRLNRTFLREVEEVKRSAQAELTVVLQGLEQANRLALLDMDGVLVEGRFVLALARETGKEAPLPGLLDNPTVEPQERTRRIAALFEGVQRMSSSGWPVRSR